MKKKNLFKTIMFWVIFILVFAIIIYVAYNLIFSGWFYPKHI